MTNPSIRKVKNKRHRLAWDLGIGIGLWAGLSNWVWVVKLRFCYHSAHPFLCLHVHVKVLLFNLLFYLLINLYPHSWTNSSLSISLSSKHFCLSLLFFVTSSSSLLILPFYFTFFFFFSLLHCSFFFSMYSSSSINKRMTPRLLSDD